MRDSILAQLRWDLEHLVTGMRRRLWVGVSQKDVFTGLDPVIQGDKLER